MNRNDPTYVSACMDAPEGMKTVFGDPGEDASGYVHDEVYCVRDGRKMRLQILLPRYTGELMTREAVKLGAPNVLPFEKAPNPLYPLIVFIQGSAWNRQDLYKAIPRMSRFVRKGYAVACVEYRESACSIWPAQLVDVKTAIRYIKANADLFGIDKNRVAIMGTSSGGHLSQMTALTMGFKEFAVFPTLWDENNPCRIYAAYIGEQNDGSGASAPPIVEKSLLSDGQRAFSIISAFSGRYCAAVSPAYGMAYCSRKHSFASSSSSE